jgi:hypothetical protein
MEGFQTLLTRLRKTFWSSPKRQTVTTFIVAALVFSVLSWAYIGNSLFTCGGMNIASSEPGDGTAGLTWLSWIDKGGPLPGFTNLVNAPFGETLRDPFQITSMISITGMWLFSSLTGSSICAWNMMVFMGFMSSALAMFAFIRWLLKNNWIAFFAACAVTFTPFHQMKSHGHLSYMFNFFFVLAVWAFFAFWRNPTKKNAILLALTTAVCAYQDGYFLLLGGTLIGSIIAGSFIADTLIFKKGTRFITQRLKGMAVYIIATLILVAPIVLVQLKYSGQINSTLASTRGDIAAEAGVYGARPIEYILPTDNHPFMPQSYSLWREARLHGSNFTESTLYLGFVVMALAVVAWVLLYRHNLHKVKFRGLPLPFILGVITFAMLCAFLISLPPTVTIFGQKLPLPSWFIIHITAVWRVFSRLYLVVDTCIVILASIGLYLATRNMARTKQIVFILLATLITMVELITQSRALTWNYNTSPAVYNWLKTQANVQTIAEFPLSEQPSLPAIRYLTYQQIHGKAIFNSSRTDSPQRTLRASMQGLADAQTLPILRTLGIDVVLSHYTEVKNVPGLELVRVDPSHYNDDKVWTYRVLPGEKADWALVAADGFHLPKLNEKTQHGKIPMGSHGVMEFQPLSDKAKKHKSDTVHVSLTAKKAGGKEQFVSFTQQGIVRWQGIIDGTTDISFDADPTVAVEVIPYKSTANTTIELYNLKATQ